MKKLEIYFDGSCQPFNPGGRGGFGWIAYLDGKYVAQNYGFIGEGGHMSSNVAEYAAVIDAMNWVIREHPDKKVKFLGDSNLVIRQLCGNWKIKHGLYTEKAREARSLAFMKGWAFKWVPREKNTEADALSEMGSA